MGDATCPHGGDAEELEALRSTAAELVGEVTHSVLALFRSQGLLLSEQIALAGGDPLEVIDVFVVTLRALADGLEEPSSDWPND